jgi:hypothetical protein
MERVAGGHPERVEQELGGRPGQGVELLVDGRLRQARTMLTLPGKE